MTSRPLAVGMLAVGSLLALGVTSCSNPESDATAPRNASPGERLVVMSPSAAEMLEQLGLLDRVVAVGEYGPWPSPLAELPVAGGYATPNVEQVLALRADTVITVASEVAQDAHRKLEALGVEVLALDTSTHVGVFESLEQLGRAFDLNERAAEIHASLKDELAAIDAEAIGLPRPGVLFVVGRDPMYVAGPGSHVDGMIAQVGARNVAEELLAPYAQLSMEAVLEQMPDVIIDTSDNRAEASLGPIVGSWSRWPSIPAVGDGRVYRVHPSRLVIPGIRLPEMTRLMGRLIHPKRFGEPTAADFQPLESGDVGPPS